jgi:methenyltetrahydrofolate cyclohydrolase
MSFSNLSVHAFLRALASPEPTPGGGTAAAVAGAMGTGLLLMVAGLPRTRANTDEEREALTAVRGELAPLLESLERCADRDSDAYNAVLGAYRRPKSTEEEKAARKIAIAEAMRGATEAPVETLRAVAGVLHLGESIARYGNPSAASDVGVAAGLLVAAADGAAANVRINLGGLADEIFRQRAAAETDALLARTTASAAVIRAALA